MTQTLAELKARLSAENKGGRTNQPKRSFMDEASEIPGYALEAAKSLPGNLYNFASMLPAAGEKLLTHPIEAGQDFAGGLTRNAQRLAATLGEAGQGIASKLTGGYAPRTNIREEMGLTEKNPVDLGSKIESNNPDPFFSMMGQTGVPSGMFGTSLPRLIAGAATNAAMQADPGDRTQAATEGAVNTFLTPMAFKGAKMGANAMRPSRLLRGNLSLADLKANLEAARGTNTSLGDVVGSPNLKRVYENILPNIPMSGAYSTMQKTANQITGRGEALLTKIGKDLPEGDKTEALQSALKQASREATRRKNQNYSQVNKIADEIGLKVGRRNFQTKAQEILNDIKESPELEREFSPDMLESIREYAAGNKGANLKLSNIFKGKLGDKANDLFINGNKHESRLMNELKESLGMDIDKSIESSNHPDLMNAYDKAQKEYGSKFKPFEDPNILKFTREGGDADLMLSHFLKGGSNDRGALLNKLTSKLPEDLKKLPLYMHLSKALDEESGLNPLKFKTLYDKLGEKQRNALIPDREMRNEIEKYTKTVGLNKETFNTMFNPKTGQRNLDSAMGAMEGLLAFTHPAKAVAGVALGHVATKLLTSERFRESLVKAMLKRNK